MVRTILTPANTHIELDIPAEYVGRKVEITCFPVDEYKGNNKKRMSDFWGILSDETTKELHSHIIKSRDEWERGI